MAVTTVRLQIRGFADLERALERMGDRAEKALADAAMAGALPVVNEIVPRTPYKTGNLRRSYHAEPLKSSAREAWVAVGTDVEYAPFQEFGTSKMAARPHVRPGLAAGTPHFVDEAARALGDIIARST